MLMENLVLLQIPYENLSQFMNLKMMENSDKYLIATQELECSKILVYSLIETDIVHLLYELNPNSKELEYVSKQMI